MRKLHLILLAALLGASLGMAPAMTPSDTAEAEGAAGKTGVCIHVPRVQQDPLCVLVDPSE